MAQRQFPPQLLYAGLCLAIFAIWSYHLTSRALWWDESFSIGLALKPIPLLLTEAVQDVHPPAYYLLLRGWLLTIGPTAWSMRLFSLFLAVPLLPLAMVCGRRWGSPAAGASAGVLVGLAPFVLHHVREVRMYSLGLTLTLLAFYLYAQLLQPKKQPLTLWLAYGFTLWLGLLTHYLFALVPAGQALGLISQSWHTPVAWRKWLAVAGGVGIASWPWLGLAQTQLAGLQTNRAGQFSFDGLTSLVGGSTLIAGYGWLEVGQWWLALPAGLVALVGFFHLWRKQSTMALALGVSYILPWFILGVVNITAVENIGRVVRLGFSSVPLFWLAVAYGLEPLKRGRWLVVAFFLGLYGWHNGQLYQPTGDVTEDYRPLAEQLNQVARPGDAVLTTYLWQDGHLASYAPQLNLALYRNHYDVNQIDPFLRPLFAQHQRVWVVNYGAEADVYDVSNPFNVWLHQQGALVWVERQGLTQMALFYSNLQENFAWSKPVWFNNGIGLSFVAPPTERQAPDVLPVYLRWQSREPITESLKVFVHLQQVSTGQILAQHDGWPVGGVRPVESWLPGEFIVDRRAVLLRPELPPSEYLILVGLYNALTGERVTLPADPHCPQVDVVCVGFFDLHPVENDDSQ